MADILIRGMEMPKDRSLWLLIRPDGKVYKIKNGGKYGELKIGTAVPLLEGHGDLIDKAEAYDRIAEQEGGNYIDMDSVGLGLEECQIIVPAERCGEADKKTNCSDCGNRNTPVCKYCEHDAEGGGED